MDGRWPARLRAAISRRGIRSVLAAAVSLTLSVAVLVLPPVSAVAQETVTVTGELDYEARPPAAVVESIAVNIVTLEFPLEGGPFSGTAVLELVHDVPDRGCQFQSTHRWEFSGDFNADTGEFTGRWVEVEDVTVGECENFSFIRDFNPAEDDFRAGLIAQLGRITGRVSPAQFTLEIDPALFDTAADGEGDITTSPDLTTDPGQTGDTGDTDQPPATAPPVTTVPDQGAFPWLPVVIALILGGAAVPLIRRWLPKSPGQEPEESDRDCSELERMWREAQNRCDEVRRRSEDLSNEFDRATEQLRAATDARAGLPSEETRVELPDGTSLSQLDLALRRAAAREAWDAYLADPSPESAAAAERAWEQQATPEWLEAQRAAHQAEKERLEEAVERAQADKDRVGRDLADARAREQTACDEAADLRRRLDECLAHAAAAATPPAPAPQPQPPVPVGSGGPLPPPPPSPSPPSGGSEPTPPDDEDTGPCRDGDERWIDIDGPHPSTIPTDSIVHVAVALISGTRRAPRLGSLDRSEFVNLGANGETTGIGFRAFAGLSEGDIRGAFSGPGGLADVWRTPGSGADQRFTLTVTYGKRSVLASCDRKEVCVGGSWQPQAVWRPRVSGDSETVTASISVEGNTPEGLAVDEKVYLDRLVAFLRSVQSQVRLLVDAKDTFDQYQRDCRAGRR